MTNSKPSETSEIIEFISIETERTIMPKGEPIFSESATKVRIEDEAAGEFVEVVQERDDTTTCVRIDPQEWPLLRAIIDLFFTNIRQREADK